MSATAFNSKASLDERRVIRRRRGCDVERVELPWGQRPCAAGARPLVIARYSRNLRGAASEACTKGMLARAGNMIVSCMSSHQTDSEDEPQNRLLRYQSSDSAEISGRNFSPPSNQFWNVLHLSGFTDMRLQPEDERRRQRRCNLQRRCPPLPAAAALRPSSLSAACFSASVTRLDCGWWRLDYVDRLEHLFDSGRA
jgi:hypothetical protein